MTDESTKTLVEHLTQGRPQGATLLEQQFRAPLIRFCWGYLGRMEEAEDAVQEIFVKVLQAAEIPLTFRPWIYRIARNQCLNMLRGQGRRRDGKALPVTSQIDAELTGQLTGLVKDEQHAQLLEMVHNLDQSHREALRLRYVEGLSRAEIAAVLEISEAAVKSRLFDGLKQLRAKAPDLDME